jgi:hypothetical protein
MQELQRYKFTVAPLETYTEEKVIERVSEITEVQIRDEQGGFRKGRGCVDQVFVLKCVCEKYLEK